jgi:type I restriction enzyme R subunit
MSERSAVQNPMLTYAAAIGWERVGAEQALEWRGGDRGLFFAQILREQLLTLNPGVVSQANVDEIIRLLSLLPPNIQGNQKALGWMKGEQSVFVTSEKRERNVRLIDFDQPEHNRFFVTDEWWQRGVAHRNRADVVFLINGLPVALAETKCATKMNGLEDGITQVRRYHTETPEMFTHAQLFEVTELIRFYYGVSWAVSRKGLFNWKLENKAQTATYEATIKGFFDRQRFLQTLQHYILFLTKEDELTKVILRQHQTCAVEKALERSHEGDKYRGLIWHTQGSGKTLTMITIASRLLHEVKDEDKPTVLMLIDRNELEGQLEKNIIAYGINHYEMANSKKALRELLGSDYRGLIVSMIHKFKDVPKDLNTRKSVIVLVDEAHRTTGGDLGNYLMGALPNATYIGFTGTPIDKLHKGEGTFKVFGVDDEKGYLDKYSIAESIEDGTTVALNYSLAPSELKVERAVLEKQFLNMSETEGVSDIEELNAILDRAVELKEMMKNSKRVAEIGKFVAEHFKANVEPMGFKAFLVGVDREACVLYKQELDKHLPPEYSTVVYSAAHNDKPLLKQYQLDELQEKEVRRQFIKKGGTPKILIVTEKLLTGFDAPILY